MAGLIGKMLQRFTRRQVHFFENLPAEARKKFAEIENKYGHLTVTGPEGGVFNVQYKQRHFQIIDQPGVPYEELDKFVLDGDAGGYPYPSGDEVLFDVIDGSLSPRTVIARKYFWANTDKVIYDTEEFAQAFEQFLEEMRMVLGVKR